MPWLEAAEGDDTSGLVLIFAECPAVVVDRVQVELLARGDRWVSADVQ